MNESLENLQKNLGYRFKDISLLETALTHSSYANERIEKTAYNERLEFLGDSVLGFVSAKYFYQNFDGVESLGFITLIVIIYIVAALILDIPRKYIWNKYLLPKIK